MRSPPPPSVISEGLRGVGIPVFPVLFDWQPESFELERDVTETRGEM